VRYLILSDIHANIDALEAVLTAAPASAWDRVVVLGDLVGYGAEPNAVIDRVRALDPLAVVRGNHDRVACGIDDAENFNQIARFAATWTFSALTPANRDYLHALPMGPVTIDERVEVCHGTPFDEDHYVFDADDALMAFEAATRPVCLFGHTHMPVVFQREGQGRVQGASRTSGGVVQGDDVNVEVCPGVRYLVNPGSVGQPRDGDPRAAFGIYDDGDGVSLVLRRVEYPVDRAQRRILNAGLPPSLANRLAIGR
jgi:predicted phosphodiesterase